MTTVEKALKVFDEGFVCSQAVLAAYAEQYGLNQKDAYKIATAFGGGIACTADLCGAVSGALMVIGLANGRTDIEDKAARNKTYELSRFLMDKIKNQFGSVNCKQILGEDISTPEGMDRALELKLFETTCRDCIKFTTKTLDSIL